MKKYEFPTLVLSVAVAGLSQGLTLPLLSILLEKQGISSTLNGWSAASLYVGMLGASLFVEKPTRRFGFKPMILFGIVSVMLSSLLIPLWNNIFWWFLLRFCIGAGDSTLHYATQLWITSSSAPKERGKKISFYGFAYGAGFCIGPFGVNLLSYGIWAPFLVVAVFYLFSFFLVLQLENRYAQAPDRETKVSYLRAIGLGWFALLPALVYGFLESVLNGAAPIYVLRIGMDEGWVSLVLFAFSAGALLTQLPLGVLSDRIGRRKILMGSACTGSIGFFCVPFAGNHVIWVTLILGVTGALVGSFFSLGLAYLADILPGQLLPTGNVLASMLFSVGSMVGPGIAGMGIQYIDPASLFYFLGALFGIFFLTGFVSRQGIQLEANH